MDRFEKALGAWVVRHRWWLILAAVLAVGAAGIGARFLTVNNDTRVFFSAENPQLQALEALENTYNKINTVLFVIAPRDGHVFSRETLALPGGERLGPIVVEPRDPVLVTTFQGSNDAFLSSQHADIVPGTFSRPGCR